MSKPSCIEGECVYYDRKSEVCELPDEALKSYCPCETGELE